MKKSTRLLALAVFTAAVASLSVFAQEGGTAFVAPSRVVGEYAGVKPGSNNPPPRIARINAARTAKTRRGRSTLLTWPGFEPRASGSRFFLQVSSLIVTETNMSEGRFELILRNVRTHLRNTQRPLITRYFNTPVTRARVQRRGRNDLVVVFDLRAQVTPRVSTGPGAGGFHFIYVDFPSGNYADAPDVRANDPLPPAPTADDRPGGGLTDAELRELNEERPPGQ